MKPILLADFGSTYTKVTAVDVEGECILGTAKSFTTISTDINEGLNNALEELYLKIGQIDFVDKYACSSAAGGLKMVAIGLVPELTAEAAKRAALSAGAKVMKVFSYELSEEEKDEIESLSPDIVLLTGGTDGGNQKVILHNAKIIAEVNGAFPVVIAGNKSVSKKVADIILSSGKSVKLCENVMPEFNVLNVEPAKQKIRETFLERIVMAKGLTKIQELMKGILMPTPSSVLKAANLLAVGHENENGIGELILVDVGGATTDLYSIAKGEPKGNGVTISKGLPEPFAKRTVEGDLGVRYSSAFLVEEAGIENVSTISGLTEKEIEHSLELIQKNPDILPQEDKKIGRLDFALASLAVKHAMERHTGHIEIAYTPLGPVNSQIGKDLTQIRKIIATGGPIINSADPGSVMSNVMENEEFPMSLRPKEAEFFLDSQYILAAMGLLSEVYPEVALRIMKKELLKV